MSRRSKPAWTATPCWCSTTSPSPTTPGRILPQFGDLEATLAGEMAKPEDRRMELEMADISNVDRDNRMRPRTTGSGWIHWVTGCGIPTPRSARFRREILDAVGAHNAEQRRQHANLPTCAPPTTRWMRARKPKSKIWSRNTRSPSRARSWASPTSPTRIAPKCAPVRHRLVSTHPVTGRNSLYLASISAASSAGRCPRRAPSSAT